MVNASAGTRLTQSITSGSAEGVAEGAGSPAVGVGVGVALALEVGCGAGSGESTHPARSRSEAAAAAMVRGSFEPGRIHPFCVTRTRAFAERKPDGGGGARR